MMTPVFKGFAAVLVAILSGLLVLHAQENTRHPFITPDNAAQLTLLAELTVRQPESLAWSPDGTTLAVISDDDMYLFNLHDLEMFPIVMEGSFWRTTFRPDGTPLALQRRDGRTFPEQGGVFFLVDVQTGERLATLNIRTEFITSPVFSYDGTMLALGDAQSHIQLWDLASGELLGMLKGHAVPPSTLAFSYDNRFLASGAGTGDHLVFLWDIATLSPLRVLSDVPNVEIPAEVVAFSPNGQWFVTGTSRGEPLVRWDLEALTAEPQISLTEIEAEREVLIDGLGSVFKVVFSPNNLILAAEYHYPAFPSMAFVRLLDMQTGTTLLEWESPNGLACLSLSADGTLLATAGDDSDTVQVWGHP